jgi:hypothetical protein
MKNVVFWDVALCRSCVNRRFGETYRLHLQGRRNIAGYFRLVAQSAATCPPLRWRPYVPPKSRLTQDLHRATSQKTTFFIVTAVKVSNLTRTHMFISVNILSITDNWLSKWRQRHLVYGGQCSFKEHGNVDRVSVLHLWEYGRITFPWEWCYWMVIKKNH